MNHRLLMTNGLSTGYISGKQKPTIISSGLDIQLNEGELVCLVGPNGAGKSTLLRTLIGLQPPVAGDVFLKGKNIADLTTSEKSRLLSIVMTSPVSAGHLTAYDVAALGRYPYTGWSGSLSKEDRFMVSSSLDAVGATNLSHRFIHELSDGEKQKVMIARGLAQDPSLLILDEPTAFLDLPHRVEVMRILRSLSRHPGRAVLLSTHDLDLAIRSADRLWLIDGNNNFISGAPEDLVLRGVFGSAFDVKGVHFDREKGVFVISPEEKGHACLSGAKGMEHMWTTRALERAGYKIVGPENAELHIEVGIDSDIAFWDCRFEDNTNRFNSIGDMVHFLRKLTATEQQTEGLDPVHHRRGE
ncbi:iron complex transport system ATP-binding protein [Methanococcoides vulcani]|uniref:Iron complex transport system ATP-binding protein n=1 Tax=Methanococcoides vulcani TaxID=1353158 RepID=A0A1H9YM97_9EURY|nr:ABC transporter ATP-binding protein [Methanococcoides vulcani]SES70249.1 iron complex transport system ATP-binding protein [Methanococcoides vulcani]